MFSIGLCLPLGCALPTTTLSQMLSKHTTCYSAFSLALSFSVSRADTHRLCVYDTHTMTISTCLCNREATAESHVPRVWRAEQRSRAQCDAMPCGCDDVAIAAAADGLVFHPVRVCVRVRVYIQCTHTYTHTYTGDNIPYG